jgi:hypothetical protein
VRDRAQPLSQSGDRIRKECRHVNVRASGRQQGETMTLSRFR